MLLSLGLLSAGVYAQAPVSAAVENAANERTINHRVELGESVLLIAKKYKVLPSDIYEFNPDATEGISQGMLIKIPLDRAIVADATPRKQEAKEARPYHPVLAEAPKAVKPIAREEKPVSQQFTASSEEPAPTVLPNGGVFDVTHNVTTGETLTGLARKYNTTVSAITEANGSKLRNGLQIGQVITIPAGPTPETLSGVVIHEVAKGETLFGLARQYNTTVEDITEYNKRKLKNGLQTGQELSIMPNTVQPVIETPAEPEPVVQEVKAQPVKKSGAEDTSPRNIVHILKDGDTLDSLASQYHTSVDAIKEVNKKNIRKGLQAGQQITIPAYKD